MSGAGGMLAPVRDLLASQQPPADPFADLPAKARLAAAASPAPAPGPIDPFADLAIKAKLAANPRVSPFALRLHSAILDRNAAGQRATTAAAGPPTAPTLATGGFAPADVNARPTPVAEPSAVPGGPVVRWVGRNLVDPQLENPLTSAVASGVVPIGLGMMANALAQKVGGFVGQKAAEVTLPPDVRKMAEADPERIQGVDVAGLLASLAAVPLIHGAYKAAVPDIGPAVGQGFRDLARESRGAAPADLEIQNANFARRQQATDWAARQRTEMQSGDAFADLLIPPTKAEAKTARTAEPVAGLQDKAATVEDIASQKMAGQAAEQARAEQEAMTTAAQAKVDTEAKATADYQATIARLDAEHAAESARIAREEGNKVQAQQAADTARDAAEAQAAATYRATVGTQTEQGMARGITRRPRGFVPTETPPTTEVPAPDVPRETRQEPEALPSTVGEKILSGLERGDQRIAVRDRTGRIWAGEKNETHNQLIQRAEAQGATFEENRPANTPGLSQANRDLAAKTRGFVSKAGEFTSIVDYERTWHDPVPAPLAPPSGEPVAGLEPTPRVAPSTEPLPVHPEGFGAGGDYETLHQTTPGRLPVVAPERSGVVPATPAPGFGKVELPPHEPPVGTPKGVAPEALTNPRTMDAGPQQDLFDKEYARIQAKTGLDKTHVPFSEQRAAAQAFARLIGIDPLQLKADFFSRLSGPEVVELKNKLKTNMADFDTFTQQLAKGGQSMEHIEAINASMDRLRAENDHLMTGIVRGAESAGRDLGFLRQYATHTYDADSWVIQAKRLAGNKMLTDEQIADIRKAANDAARICKA